MAGKLTPTGGRTAVGLVAICAAVAACSSPEAFLASEIEAQNGEERDCSPGPFAPEDFLQPTPEELSLRLSSLVFECSDDVVVSEVANVDAAAVEAAEREAPLLITSTTAAPAVADEILRLEVDEVIFVGEPSDPLLLPEDAVMVAVPPPTQTVPETDTAATDTVETDTAETDTVETVPGADVWLYRPADEALVSVARPFFDLGAVELVALPDGDAVDLARTQAGSSISVLGPLNPTEVWQAKLRFTGPELPGGGITLFPGRRFVAFYGSPITFRLGLLGEQGPEQTMERLRPHLAEYQIPGGEPVLPAFELIATVADSAAGDDNDYSNELDPAELRPWIDVITANNGYAIIDLQPGRTDFLTQAKRYEEYLKLPNVGLALDPEWRIEADAVHLRQIGTVDAAEVNTVVDWLAELVRVNGLPQKMLVLHQFQAPMITARETIRTPPELSLVIHVDGQGPLSTKFGTWAAMQALPVGPEQTIWWGWKNFLDEDLPMATPAQVNAVAPLPVVVTFQ